jgi:hypothetical protein
MNLANFMHLPSRDMGLLVPNHHPLLFLILVTHPRPLSLLFLTTHPRPLSFCSVVYVRE